MGAHDRIPPIQQSPGMKRPVELPAEPSGTRHFSQINERTHPVDHRLRAGETLGPPPLFKAKPATPTLPAGSRRSDRARQSGGGAQRKTTSVWEDPDDRCRQEPPPRDPAVRVQKGPDQALVAASGRSTAGRSSRVDSKNSDAQERAACSSSAPPSPMPTRRRLSPARGKPVGARHPHPPPRTAGRGRHRRRRQRQRPGESCSGALFG